VGKVVLLDLSIFPGWTLRLAKRSRKGGGARGGRGGEREGKKGKDRGMRG